MCTAPQSSNSLTDRLPRSKGFSLVDTMVSLVILVIAVLGVSKVRYYTTLDTQKAERQTTAAQTAILLGETWRGTKGSESFNPVAQLGADLTITQTTAPKTQGKKDAEGFFLLDNYKLTLDQVNYYATLSWKDIDKDLRALNVLIAWAQNGQASDSQSTDKEFEVTIYAQQW